MNQSTEQEQIRREQTCGCQGRGEREWDRQRVWDWQMQTITFRMDKQCGPTVQHRELYPGNYIQSLGMDHSGR